MYISIYILYVYCNVSGLLLLIIIVIITLNIDDVARIVACSTVDSRLDYCNSLFVGMTDRIFKKLQRVQNTLARVVQRAGKFEHTTPALIQLHWLPVKQRALYKLALITFNVLQHNNPMYLRNLLTTHNLSRNLHSSSQHLLSVGYMRTVSSSRCFKHSAAINWNDLPYDIRSCDSVNVFKRKFKTHLFNIAYATYHATTPTNNILVTYGTLQVLYCIVL